MQFLPVAADTLVAGALLAENHAQRAASRVLDKVWNLEPDSDLCIYMIIAPDTDSNPRLLTGVVLESTSGESYSAGWDLRDLDKRFSVMR